MDALITQKEVVSFQDLKFRCGGVADLELGHQLGHGYLHLNDGEPLANADPRSTSKWKIRERDNLVTLWFQKPFRLKFVWLREELRVVVHGSKWELDDGASLDFEWTKHAVL